MNQQQAEELLAKYVQGTASDQERAIVERWYESEAAGRKLEDDQFFEHLNGELWAGTLEKAGIGGPVRRRLSPVYRVAAAAILLLLSAGVMYYMNSRQTVPVLTQTDVPPQHIIPGMNKAVLTLSDGSEISLADADDGELAMQGATRISKTKDGQLLYEPKGGSAGGLKHNTISTPRGGQYQVDLPDGTRVWLNAASSLTFPFAFNGLAERRVTLSGEAYFEVAKDAHKPFIVVSRGQTIEVLGTYFNVNAYQDEPGIKTTLVEGAVKVNGRQLAPGQQSVLREGKISVVNVEPATETAWKNGEFIFNGQDFKTVMRMISRWYDVDVIYEYDPRQFRIGGEVSRSRSIQEVLRMLEVTGDVKLKIEGRKIRVIR